MGKGKGRRRRQANYLAAHGNHAALPAPPTASDVAALPSKLRRIITLKSSTPHGKIHKTGKSIIKNPGGVHGKQPQKQKRRTQEDGSNVLTQGQLEDGRDVGPSEASEPKQKKKRKQEDELQALSEKFKATPIRRGLSEHKKKYLQEKKNKKKRVMYCDSNEKTLSLHKQEKISFGEIVEAPPKLSFPKKLTNVAEERLRQQAIATYREKKKWVSRPGSHQPPPLANEATMGS